MEVLKRNIVNKELYSKSKFWLTNNYITEDGINFCRLSSDHSGISVPIALEYHYNDRWLALRLLTGREALRYSILLVLEEFFMSRPIRNTRIMRFYDSLVSPYSSIEFSLLKNLEKIVSKNQFCEQDLIPLFRHKWDMDKDIVTMELYSNMVQSAYTASYEGRILHPFHRLIDIVESNCNRDEHGLLKKHCIELLKIGDEFLQ